MMKIPLVPDRLRPFVGNYGGSLPGAQIGSISDVSTDDLMWLAHSGFELHIQADGPDAFDLSEIAMPLRHFKRLFLAGTATTPYEGWRVLESCTQLEVLQLAKDPSTQLDLTGLDRLEATTVRGPNSMSLLRAPRLESLKIVASMPKDAIVSGPIQSLSVISASVRDIHFLSNPTKLEGVLVNGSKSFDAASLRQSPALTSVWFYWCKELLGVDSLLELPHLSDVEIYGAKNVPDYRSLLGLGHATLSVEENYVFDEAFRTSANERDGWNVDPLRAAPSRRESVKAGTAPRDDAIELARAAFYALIDLARAAGPEASANPSALRRRLSKLGDLEVRAFAEQFDRELELLNTGDVGDAGVALTGRLSDDAFLDFRAYLIGRGREIADIAASNPERLSELIKTNEPFNEELEYVATDVLETRGLMP